MAGLPEWAARIRRGGWNKKRGRKRRGGREEEIGRDQKIAQHTVHEAERRKIQQEEMGLFRGDRMIQGHRWTARAFLVLRGYWD